MSAARRLFPLARCPLLSAAEYASLAGVSERRARAILARLGADGLAGEVGVPGAGPGRPARLSYLTRRGVDALAEATGATPELLVKRYALGEEALVVRLGQLDRVVPARGVLIALSQTLPGIGGALRDWRAGPVRWPAPDGRARPAILDGEGVVWLPTGVWRVALLWDGDPSIPATVLAARLARLADLGDRYRGDPRVRVPPVLVVTAAAGRAPEGYHPGILWATADDIRASGPLAAPWRGGRGPREARPFTEALAAQATTRVYATPSALRTAVEGGAPPRTTRRIAARVDAARTRRGADAPLGLAALALPPDAAMILDLVCRHPLLTAREVATAAARRPARVHAALGALGRHGLVTVEAVAGARTRAYVATMRGLRLGALAAGLDPTTYARATGALAEAGRAKSGGARRLRFLRGTPEHTRGVNAAYLSFLQATRVAGGALDWWGEWACARTFQDNGCLETLRPDAYGVLARPCGRLPFYLEVDRGTTQAWRLGRKLALYERYRLCADVPAFAVLLVLPGRERAADIVSEYRIARGREWEPGALDVRSTTARALALSGPLAPIWRDTTGRDGLRAL